MSLKYQFHFIQAMRNYFNSNGFLDVITPPMVENPGMETHIHPFEVYKAKSAESTNKYLHTSPEFMMKELLSSGEFNNIFTIGYCFRDEPNSPIHRNQFLMCEWYRKNSHYFDIMDDVQNLIIFLSQQKTYPVYNPLSLSEFKKFTVQEIFQEVLGFDILEYSEAPRLKKKIESDFPDVPLPSVECSWDDYFFLLFLNKVEPVLEKEKAVFLYEYPQQLSALSTIKKDNPKVCERFELYINGVEICNCFNELTSFEIQKDRFDFQTKEKFDLYNYTLPTPNRFLNIIKSGYPSSAGIALGVERLFKVLTNEEKVFFD